MTTHAKRNLFALCAIVPLLALNLSAEEKEEKEVPWRPYPESPEILFFESFEAQGTGSPSKGSVSEEQANPPGKKSIKMVTSYNSSMTCTLSFGRARFPETMNPNQVYLQFYIYSTDTGKLTVKFGTSKGDMSETLQIAKKKEWHPVLMKIADARLTGNKPAPPEYAVSSVTITHAPRGTEAPTTYVDDICVTAGVKPADVMGRISAAQGRIAEVTRTNTKDGFNYTAAGNDLLKAALKTANKRRKSKSVLIMGAKPGDGQEVIKALTAAAPKAKASGFSFVPASSPDNSPVGGLDDMRTLLPYNLAKSEAEFVLLMFSNSDMSGKGRMSDYVKACMDRVLEAGAIPILCTPPPGGKADNFIGGLIHFCNDLGVPWVDTATVTKPVTGGVDANGALSAAGLDAVAVTAMAALKHTDSLVRK
jgi:hypothetical protein